MSGEITHPPKRMLPALSNKKFYLFHKIRVVETPFLLCLQAFEPLGAQTSSTFLLFLWLIRVHFLFWRVAEINSVCCWDKRRTPFEMAKWNLGLRFPFSAVWCKGVNWEEADLFSFFLSVFRGLLTKVTWPYLGSAVQKEMPLHERHNGEKREEGLAGIREKEGRKGREGGRKRERETL